MSVICAQGAFSQSTAAAGNTQKITLSFKPIVVFFYWCGLNGAGDVVQGGNIKRGFGFATSATSRSCAASQSEDGQATADCDQGQRDAECILTITITRATDGEDDLQSMDSDGFTLVIDNDFPTTYRFHYLAVGGTEISHVDIRTMTNAETDGVDVDVDLGWKPDFLCALGGRNVAVSLTADTELWFGAFDGTTQAVWAGCTNDGAVDMAAGHYCRVGEALATFNGGVTAIAQQAVASFLPTGYRYHFTDTAAGGFLSYVLAIKGAAWKVFSGATKTNTTEDIALSGWGFKPIGGMVFSACHSENAENVQGDHDQLSVGAFTDSSQSGVATLDQDATADSVCTMAQEEDECYVNISTSESIQGRMHRESINSDGMAFKMTTADPAANFFWGFAVGSFDPSPWSVPEPIYREPRCAVPYV